MVVAWPEAVDAVAAAARGAQPRCGEVVVVAIDGRSGSGKTVLGREVAGRLGCACVSMDELYPGWDGLAEGVRLLGERVLEPLARGQVARQPVWDWVAGRWGSDRPVEPGAFLVVEGCGASAGPARPHAGVRVWLDAPAGVRRARALARDGEAFAPHWDAWAAQEDALFHADRTPQRADLVVRVTP